MFRSIIISPIVFNASLFSLLESFVYSVDSETGSIFTPTGTITASNNYGGDNSGYVYSEEK
jgi:hypothetical protein